MELNVYSARSAWYKVALRTYACFPVVGLLLFWIDAPHGRFNSDSLAPTSQSKLAHFFSKLNVSGRVAWIVMELPSPLILLYTYLNPSPPVIPSVNHSSGIITGPNILVTFYLVHYLNRAVVSPLRTPSRSPSNIIVPLAAIAFNLLNASLIGTYLAALSHSKGSSMRDTAFLLGLGTAIAGLVGNIWHDEVLLNIRSKKEADTKKDGQNSPKYSIPHGGLYKWISFPNYFCEWVEWTGFAVAASSIARNSVLSRSSRVVIFGLGSTGWYTPPWMFVAAEIGVMLPRAVRGHQWYKDKFAGSYPKERKAVLPGIL